MPSLPLRIMHFRNPELWKSAQLVPWFMWSMLPLTVGNVVIGRVVVEENGKLFVMTSPMTPDNLMPVEGNEVKSRKPYPMSMMPPGLINSLNKDELLDLLAYLQSGGNPNDKAFE